MSVRALVLGCSVIACAPRAQPRPAAAEATFVQYERVGVKLLLAGPPASDATAELSLEGPELIGVVVPLGEPSGNLVEADLGRVHRPGDYRVRVTEVVVTPLRRGVTSVRRRASTPHRSSRTPE